MRIVHVVFGSAPVLGRMGGAHARISWEVARRQAARGHSVVIYSTGDTSERRITDDVEIRYLAPRVRGPLRALELLIRARVELLREHTDVLHFYCQPEGAYIFTGYGARKFLTYDYFYFRRGIHGVLKPLYRRMLQAFDVLAPVSEYCMEESVRYWSLSPRRVHVLYNGVDLDQFRTDSEAGHAERQRIGIDGKLIFYLGRVNNQKGTDTLLDAFEILRSQRDDLSLAIAGPIGQFSTMKSDSEEWTRRFKDLGVRYLGAVDESRLRGLLNASDVFVMPTKEFEMFGMAAVEAQACGVPVVASDHGGLKETVPLTCGRRFPPGDEDALASQIASLLDNEEQYIEAKRNVLANAARFNWDSIVQRCESLYTSQPDELQRDLQFSTTR